MKDTILNSIVITTAFSAIVYTAIGDPGKPPEVMAVRAPRVVEMEKTVVAAKRLSPDVVLIASADR